MVKIIKYPLPEITEDTTVLSDSIAANSDEVTFSDVSDFSEDDYVLLEERGHEKNEILKITSISGNTITFANDTIFSHTQNTIVTKLLYDSFEITQSSDDDVYTQVVTDTLDYTESHGNIEYIDDSEFASDSLYYKVYYVNSHTNTKIEQAKLHQQDNFSYISVAQFRNETSITSSVLNDVAVETALQSGVEFIHDRVFRSRLLETSVPSEDFTLDLDRFYPADIDADRKITKDDITVYEVTTDGFIIAIPHLITKYFPEKNKVYFSEEVPRQNRNLVISLKVSFYPYKQVLFNLKEVNKLFAINYSLRNNMNSQLRTAVSSWTAGGTSVNRDTNSVEGLIQSNEKRITELLDGILSKILALKTRFRTDRSSLDIRRRPYGYMRKAIDDFRVR